MRDQKYKAGDFCIICTDRWSYTGYPQGTLILIYGSYRDLYGGGPSGDIKSYSFFPFKNGKVDNHCSWLDVSEIKPADPLRVMEILTKKIRDEN